MNNQKAKHTPGPWTVGGEGIVRCPASGAAIGTRKIETAGGYGTIEIIDGTNEPDYNIRLLAAAPEMLETLEALLVWWTHTPGFENGEDDMPAEIFDGIRNAINKAKGY